MFAISEEEFFMIATVALIVIIPLGVRVYRYFETKRVKKRLKDDLSKSRS